MWGYSLGWGSVKREHHVGKLYSHFSHMLFTDVYRKFVINKNIYVGSRQNMTDTDTKWATSKCIATIYHAGLSALLNFVNFIRLVHPI